MMPRHFLRPVLHLLLMAVTGCLAAAFSAGPMRAEDLRTSTSLKLVPADAAVYISSLRNREIFDAFMKSKAAKKFTELPVYAMMREQMEFPLVQLQEILQDPANRQLYDLVLQMFSDEIFMYGDREWSDFGRLLQRLNMAQQMGQITGALGEMGVGPGSGSPEKAQLVAVLAALNENLDSLTVPNTVIGFKIKNHQAAEAQLARLETLLRAVLAGNDQLAGRLKRETIGDHEFLAMHLDGGMVPWDEIPWHEIEEEEGQYEPMVEKLKTLEMVISLGVFDDYVILAMGESNDHLQSMGQGKLLVDRPELAPLKKYADRPLVEISYASKDMMSATLMTEQDINGLQQLVEGVLPETMDKKLRKRIRADARELGEDLKAAVAQPGAMLEFSFLTEEGFEGYNYSWSENLTLDGSRPLTLLKHVGGSPILFVVARGKTSPQDYDVVVKWLKKMYAYFDQFGLPQMEEDERQEFQAFAKKMRPLLAQLDKANRDMLIPALKDGQVGLVIDGRTISKQWCQAMSVAEVPLPIPELAVVLGVSDAELLKEGVAQYIRTINRFFRILHELEPDEIPRLKIPDPDSEDLAEGTGYLWPLPASWGVDKALTPNAGLSDRVAVFSATPAHTRRLLHPSKPAFDSGPLADVDRPLAAAFSFNFAALVHTVEPWVEYAFDQAMKDWDPQEDSFPLPATREQVRIGMQILRCFRGVSGVSYFEDDALITHTQWRFKDLE